MTDHEELMIMIKTNDLREEGKFDEARALAKTIPITPSIAMIWKKYVGVESLKESGWNMSEAEARFGKDWLDR